MVRPPATFPFLEKISRIKPTTFNVLKTDALSGDFYWIDDSPLAMELANLRDRNLFDRWIEVNITLRPNDLLFAISELQETC